MVIDIITDSRRYNGQLGSNSEQYNPGNNVHYQSVFSAKGISPYQQLAEGTYHHT